ncbi:hypothetical protein RCL1_006482 [Eukaryota sp. TZLM3-RCL]
MLGKKLPTNPRVTTTTPFGLTVPKLQDLADYYEGSDSQAEDIPTTLHGRSPASFPARSDSSSTQSPGPDESLKLLKTIPSIRSLEPVSSSDGSEAVASSHRSHESHASDRSSPHLKPFLSSTSRSSIFGSNTRLSLIDFDSVGNLASSDRDIVASTESEKVVELAEGAVIKNTDVLTVRLHSYFEDLFSFSIDKREVCLKEICQIAWLGGHNFQIYIGSSGCIELSVELLSRDIEPISMKSRSLQLISVLTRDCSTNQVRAFEAGVFPVLADLIVECSKSLRMWACNCLFNCLWNNETLQEAVKLVPHLAARLRSTAKLDWRIWPYNDAEEVLKMLNWRVD